MANKSPFPRPCDKCETKCGDATSDRSKKCNDYGTWVKWWWHEYKRRLFHISPTRKSEKFCYEHPDIVRNYLKHSPCEKCGATDCDTPCSIYLRWYDARIEMARKKVGL